MTLDGTVLLIARESRIDLTATGTADIARLARWGIDEGELPQGQVTFRATAAGPMGDPEAAVDVASEQLSWRGVVATDLSARARVTSGAGGRRGARVRFLERHGDGRRGDSV